MEWKEYGVFETRKNQNFLDLLYVLISYEQRYTFPKQTNLIQPELRTPRPNFEPPLETVKFE